MGTMSRCREVVIHWALGAMRGVGDDGVEAMKDVEDEECGVAEVKADIDEAI